MDQFTVSSVLDVVGEFFPKDTSIAVSDEQRFIYYQPSKKINLRIRPGDIINEDTVTYKALSAQQKITEFIECNGFGTPYYGMSVPIFEGISPKGCVTAILPARPSLLSKTFLTIKKKETWVPVPYEEIMYLEAQHRKTKVYSGQGEGSHKLNLSELEMMLPSEQFIRVHRSYIVNVHHIAEIIPDYHSTFLLVMKDGAKIQVSQTYASQFRRSLGF